MRILWAKSGGLVPLDNGGKIRSFNIARELARRHDVTLFTFYPALTPDPHAELGEPFGQIERVSLKLPARATIRDTLAYAANSLSRWPYQMRKYCRPEVARRLRQLVLHKKHEILLCDFLVTAGVVPWDVGIPTVIFAHNVEALIWQRHFLTNENALWRLAAWREQRTLARAERYFSSLADHVLTVSDEDRACFLEHLPQEKVTTIPTGVDLEYFQPGSFLHTPSLVFTGSMDWKPNEDAITYFATQVLPLIQKSVPQVTLTVVGRKPTRKLLGLVNTNPAIRVTGAVDDIRPYVHNASVYVVPLRIGGGTRIKIFEAMAMGKPVVSTTIGAEGLPVTHGENILLADTPDAFASHTVELITQPDSRRRIGQAARALVESRYSWSTVADVFEHVLLEATKERDTH
jgi:glycosyltransferase involved in cell wall biosynthesis